jgi:hypothetical protein
MKRKPKRKPPITREQMASVLHNQEAIIVGVRRMLSEVEKHLVRCDEMRLEWDDLLR